MPRHLESQLQRSCIKWFRLQYPKVLGFAVPNGGKRNIREAAIMKAEGVLAGVPDFLIIHGSILTYEGYMYSGLAIEFKVGKNGLSPAQKEVIPMFEREGWKVEIVRSLDQFMDVVNEYLK